MPAWRSEFERWADGCTDNPRRVTVTSDSTFVGIFRHITAVDDAGAGSATVYTEGLTAVVNTGRDSPADITIITADGRAILRERQTTTTARYALSEAGVYIVTIAGKSYKLTAR